MSNRSSDIKYNDIYKINSAVPDTKNNICLSTSTIHNLTSLLFIKMSQNMVDIFLSYYM